MTTQWYSLPQDERIAKIAGKLFAEKNPELMREFSEILAQIRNQDTGTIKVQIVDPAKMLEERRRQREETVAAGQDATGLCTLRELVQEMRETHGDFTEMCFFGHDGRRINVEIRITNVGELP